MLMDIFANTGMPKSLRQDRCCGEMLWIHGSCYNNTPSTLKVRVKKKAREDYQDHFKLDMSISLLCIYSQN